MEGGDAVPLDKLGPEASIFEAPALDIIRDCTIQGRDSATVKRFRVRAQGDKTKVSLH